MSKGKINEIKAIFFDIDNTLYDQFEAYKKGLSKTIKEFEDVFKDRNEKEIIEAFFEGHKLLMKLFREGDSLEKARYIRIEKMLELLGLDKDNYKKINDFFLEVYPKANAPIKDAGVVVTLDKNISVGMNEGALCTETKACMYNTDIEVPVVGYIIGLGGRDIPEKTIENIVEEAKEVMDSGISVESQFTDLREDLI